MSLESLLNMSQGWPLLAVAGLAFGAIAAASAASTRRLLWFMPTIIVLALASAFFFSTSQPLAEVLSEGLPIFLIAFMPSALIALAVGVLLLRLRWKPVAVVLGTALACTLTSPLFGLTALVAGCMLTGNCL